MVFAVLSYNQLCRKQSVELSSLYKSILFYSPADYMSANLVAYIRQNTSIKTVDLHAAYAGRLVFKYTGSTMIESPTLIINRAYGPQIISGPAAVRNALDPLTDQNNPERLGRIALVIMMFLIALAFVLRDEVVRFSAFLPLLGLIAVGSLWSRCIHCYVGGTTVSAFAPLAEGIYVLGGAAIFTLARFRQRYFYIAFMIISSLVPIAQSCLIAAEPKLCPACLIGTFLSACYLVSCLNSLKTNTLSGLSAPDWARAFIILGLIVMICRHTLMLGGYISGGIVPPQRVPMLVGDSIKEYLHSDRTLQPGVIWLVTLPGCHTCADAERYLSHSSLIWHNAPPCALGPSDVCFNGKDTRFPTPMILIADKNGKIVLQREGWVGGVGRDILVSQIQSTQRRIRMGR
jgi:hypothetical protein